ncbi:uncharacterized protein LOC113394703 [Vanessa tameamea]|uniref:Uncharacterized protein LOC113394703 n=1 Tax=Vanessa tameamea TaxID=334116 RepID=A0A8B8HU29_VANTA|nr:uncharacterized protein LOC113394703 [Vanessa tameamea]
MFLSIQELTVNKGMANGFSTTLGKYWEWLLDPFGVPFSQYCFKLFYTIYTHFTLYNLMIFLVKCVPTGIYMYKFIKNIYIDSRERLKQKEIELEDIRLQIQIINTKIKLRDAEFAERGELLRRKVEQLHHVRKRVQEIIVSDEELRTTINGNAPWEEEKDCNVSSTPEEECKFIMELLVKLKADHLIAPERDRMKMNCGEHFPEPVNEEDSVYSSANDVNKQDYHVKIVKVTNVYKVAYLRHFIKQKRLRRANKQAILRKKMDSIKKLLDDWQKTLKMVINNKLINLDSKNNIEMASQEAMGDFTKPKFNNSSDSDSDYRNSTGSYQDDYCVSWSQNQYRPVCSYDEFNTNFENRSDCYDLDECCTKYKGHEEICDCTATGILFVVPEETNSQVAIEDIKSDNA